MTRRAAPSWLNVLCKMKGSPSPGGATSQSVVDWIASAASSRSLVLPKFPGLQLLGFFCFLSGNPVLPVAFLLLMAQIIVSIKNTAFLGQVRPEHPPNPLPLPSLDQLFFFSLLAFTLIVYPFNERRLQVILSKWDKPLWALFYLTKTGKSFALICIKQMYILYRKSLVL